METIEVELNMRELSDMETALRRAIFEQYDMYKSVLKQEIMPTKKDENKCLVANSLDVLRTLNKLQDLLEKIIQAQEELREQ